MSVDYTAIIFIGAEVPDNHFYEHGELSWICQSHGKQRTPFCGDCGESCDEEVEKLWGPDLLRVAAVLEKTPEETWRLIAPYDDSFSTYSDMGKFGRWRLGYDACWTLYGTAVARMSDDDKLGCSKSVRTAEQMQVAIESVEDAFKAYGIKIPVQVFCLQDCG